MLSRGEDLLREIESEVEKWRKYIKSISKRVSNNLGNSVLMATSIVYSSPHVERIRNQIKE